MDLTLDLVFRAQRLGQDENGHTRWEVIETPRKLETARTAIVICDMWDRHWSRGASERVDGMAPCMNAIVKAARAKGVLIVHAPSDTLDFYADTAARRRALDAPPVEPPPEIEHAEPALPIDDSDGGSDTGETPWFKAWGRQHPAIEIDQEEDVITDNGHELYSVFRQYDIRHVIMMGVHTNMCVLNRSFGIKQLVRWGIDVALARNLTDTMYNPAMPPYVSHQEGTELVVAYIEKFWCPTLEMTRATHH
jgi:nicotinamidase-related amidase